jgi:hypothetical protein
MYSSAGTARQRDEVWLVRFLNKMLALNKQPGYLSKKKRPAF